ncbi:hypothetical protein ANN_02050 [Periplaneta americana]|uniref:MADF domain-containing protein n=1 Tax=Periplaneta americana TaxID=6978 RepID=A0ABQ8TWZ2_PERAM|nr:hypothetical protein ANN_02050 [Periplaneta americana]
MAGLCEGGNEPPGSLKAIYKLFYDALSTAVVSQQEDRDITYALFCSVLCIMEQVLFDEILILSVEENPHVYDNRRASYKDEKMEENTWLSIAASMNTDPGNEFQSLGRAIVKEDEYEEVRWDDDQLVIARDYEDIEFRPVYVIDVYKLTPSNGPKERSRRARDLTVASDNLSAIEFRPGDFFFNVETVIRNEATHRKIVFRCERPKIMFTKLEQCSWIKIEVARGRSAQECFQGLRCSVAISHSGDAALPCWKSVKVMFIVAYDIDGLLHHAHHLRPALRRKRRHLVVQNPIILHDNATSHTAAAVKDLLRRWQWEILEHPPYSPDMIHTITISSPNSIGTTARDFITLDDKRVPRTSRRHKELELKTEEFIEMVRSGECDGQVPAFLRAHNSEVPAVRQTTCDRRDTASPTMICDRDNLAHVLHHMAIVSPSKCPTLTLCHLPSGGCSLGLPITPTHSPTPPSLKLSS